jgi:hypothetical protein
MSCATCPYPQRSNCPKRARALFPGYMRVETSKVLGYWCEHQSLETKTELVCVHAASVLNRFEHKNLWSRPIGLSMAARWMEAAPRHPPAWGELLDLYQYAISNDAIWRRMSSVSSKMRRDIANLEQKWAVAAAADIELHDQIAAHPIGVPIWLRPELGRRTHEGYVHAISMVIGTDLRLKIPFNPTQHEHDNFRRYAEQVETVVAGAHRVPMLRRASLHAREANRDWTITLNRFEFTHRIGLHERFLKNQHRLLMFGRVSKIPT